MTHAVELPHEPGNEPPDYKHAFAEFLEKSHPNVELSDAAKRIIPLQLTELWRRYGNPASETYLAYHNDTHTFDTMERGFQVLSLVSKIPKVTITNEDYELLGLAIAYHDDEQHGTEDMSPEEISADNLGNVMRAYDYSPEQIGRAQNAVLATEVTITKNAVVQVNVKEQAGDIVVVSTALADIAAILFEGGQRLLDDVTTLALERSSDAKASKQILLDLIKQQHDFLNERIKDMSTYIEEHCGANMSLATQIKDAIFKYCETNFKEALSVADTMRDNLTDFGNAIERELEKPANDIHAQQERIRKALLGVVRRLMRQIPQEEG